MDIKEIENLALISSAHHLAIVDLLLEKGIFTKEELLKKTAERAGLTETGLIKRIADMKK